MDDVTPADAVHEAGGFQFVMDRTLLDQAGPVKVDYKKMGFRISSNLQLKSGCQNCGTTGSCCSSG